MSERGRGGAGGGRVGGRPPLDRTRVLGLLFAGAMVAAPFLALLYGPTAGLTVATLALAATAALAGDAARGAGPAARRRLVVAAAVNGGLAVACLIAVVVRLT